MDDYNAPIDNVTTFNRATETVRFLKKQLPEALQRPRLGVICGSGLGSLAETVLPQPRHEVPYAAIPHFPSGSGRHDAHGQRKWLMPANTQQSMAMPAGLSWG